MTRRKTTQEFIEEAKKVHGNKYDYSETKYINSTTKVKIKCNKCNTIFEQLPNNHLHGKGCNICGQLRVHQKRLKTTEDFISIAKTLNKNKYDFSEFKYKGAKVKGKVWCNTCKEFFYTTPSNFLKGRGCPKCAIKSRATKKASTTEEFIERAKKIHGNKYDYSKVQYVNSNTLILIKCNHCNKFFTQKPHKHLIGQGCPFCRNNRSSKEEQFIIKILSKKFKSLKTQYKSDLYPFACDFYIPEINTYIEYQGYWSHGKIGTKVLGPYNHNNSEHQQVLNKWKEKSNKHSKYKRAITVWTVSDPLKRKTAKDNGLNWLEFWTIDEFMQWYNSI